MLPEQGAIWSYPLADAPNDAIIVNMINAMMQRIHLSGKITQQTEEGLALIREGVACYKTFREKLKEAIPFYPIGLPDYHGEWLCLAHRCPDRILMAVWRQNTADASITIPLCDEFSTVRVLYPSCYDGVAEACDGAVKVTLPDCYTAVLLEIQ